MILRLISLCCCLWLLSGCQSKVAVPAGAQLYLQTINNFPPAEQLPPYATLYQSYLQSAEVAKTAPAWREWQQKAETQNCQQLDWQQGQKDNFWTLAFYRHAIQCFSKQPDKARLKYWHGYLNYLQSGILQTGHGKTSYGAYQINLYQDGHDLMQLLGMQVLDYYAELSASNNALHYVLQVYDSGDQKFKAIYLENQRYLHALDQIPFPFTGLVDGWSRQMQPEYTKTNSVLLVPVAMMLQQQGDTTQAVNLYQQAINTGSHQAAVKLAELCYQAELTLSKNQCHQWLLAAADDDYVPAMQFLLFLHQSGRLGKVDADNIRLQRAQINELAGAGQAELQLSRYYFGNKFGKSDPAQGDFWLKEAAAAGMQDARAFYLLSQLEQHPEQHSTLAEQLKPLADQGNSIAAYLYASQLMQENPPPAKVPSAEAYLLQASKNWHPEALYLLGYGYEEAVFGDAKPELALHYYRLAAERFFSRAMLRLGTLYRDGELPPKDSELANRWFMLCSKQGNVACAFNAGLMFDDGDGVSQDAKTAAHFYQYAAAEGYTPAKNRLALLYLFGKGVKEDTTKALALLTEAAAAGSNSANYYLGLLYFEGKVVPRDFAKAKLYFEQAGEHPNAIRYLQNWQQMTGQQLRH